jgi:hypothetical protein
MEINVVVEEVLCTPPSRVVNGSGRRPITRGSRRPGDTSDLPSSGTTTTCRSNISPGRTPVRRRDLPSARMDQRFGATSQELHMMPESSSDTLH